MSFVGSFHCIYQKRFKIFVEFLKSTGFFFVRLSRKFQFLKPV